MIVIPNILKVYDGKFPEGDVHDQIGGWGFTREEIEKNAGKLLTLDVDFSSGDQCSLNCPHCYSHNGSIDASNSPPISFEEQVRLIEQGKELGLKTIKLLGRGEHTEHPRLLEYLEEVNRLGIVPLMFTKGHVIGDDEMARKYHGHRGIRSGEDLAKRLAELNARILLGFRSFDTVVEDRGVGNVWGYSEKRNRALELLVQQGFNQHHPTHIGLMAIPVTKETIGDVFEIYTWGKERNMGVCVTPSMVSGRGAKQVRQIDEEFSEGLINLYTKIYAWNIGRGIHTLDQLREEGVSAYAGLRPCQQVGCGLYVTLFGDVYICPGDDSPNVKFGNIRDKSLKDIWEASPNFKRAGHFNYHCPAKDGKTIPRNLYAEVLRRLEEMKVIE